MNMLGQILSGEPKAYHCNCYKVVSFHQPNGAISHNDTMKGSVVIWGCSRKSPTPEETHGETRDNAQRRKYFNDVQFLRLGICTSLVVSNCLSLTIHCL